jgi:inner membrane protein
VASLGHIAVGMASGRQGWRAMAAWSALSLLPDADVIGFAIGVRYGDPWGHRGATHSIAFALAIAAGVALIAPALRLSRARLFVVASGVLVSHGLLDTMTDGGLGVALLWPFDLTRYFAPWRPIPVAPIGLAMLSPRGVFVLATEAILFAPLVFHAMRWRVRWKAVPLWVAAVWLMVSTDPAREAVVGVVLREQTHYAPGFSERAFRRVAIGQRDADVRRAVGAPLGEYWDYFLEMVPTDEQSMPACPYVYLEADRVTWEPRDRGPAQQRCDEHGIHAGMSRADVVRIAGPPPSVCWRYSRSAVGGFHRARMVCFERGAVVAVMRRWERG